MSIETNGSGASKNGVAARAAVYERIHDLCMAIWGVGYGHSDAYQRWMKAALETPGRDLSSIAGDLADRHRDKLANQKRGAAPEESRYPEAFTQ